MTEVRRKFACFTAQRIGLRCRTMLRVAALSSTILVANHASAALMAGDIISNMAVGEYREEGSTVIQKSRSNLVQTTILPVYAFSLTADRSQNAVTSQVVSFSHLLTNTGNTADRYNLAATNLATGDNFDYTNITVYADANQDGIPDGAAITSYNLGAGQSVGLIIEATIPATASTVGNTAKVQLAATSTNSNQTINNTDTATISNQAVLVLRKSYSVDSIISGNIVNIRINYENKGTSATGQVSLTDTLDAGLTYQAGGENWNGTAVNPASGTNDPSGINYYLDTDGKTIRAILTSVPANSSGYIEFSVKVNQTTAGKIPNIVSASYDHDNNTGTAELSTVSNTAALSINPYYGVVMNANPNSASNTIADDQVTVPNVIAGSEVSFTNYVWNTGNTEDRFNLSIFSDTFPTPHQVEFYREDGVTPLLDTNGDGIPDTGRLASGQKLPIVVKLRMPTTNEGTGGTTYTLRPQAKSLADATKTDTVTDSASISATNLSVDLINQPETTNNGFGNGNISNAGSPWKTLTANSNGQVIFPLNVKHTGTATSYQFSADGDGDFSKLELPAGVSSIRYMANTSANNDCSSLGTEIGQTRLLGNGESQTYCAVVQLQDITATSVNLPIYFAVRSATYADSNTVGFDSIMNAITINSLNATGTVTIDPDLRGQIAPGGTIVYTHTIHNYTNATLSGTYQLVTQHDAGFTTTYYFDSNNNGQLDSTDSQINTSSISGSLFPANSHVRIFAKVQSPLSAPVGVTDTGVILLKDSLGNVIDSATDITRVTQTQLRLYKLQANDNDCNGVADSSYTTNGLTIGRNSDNTGQCVLYRLIVKNEGATSVGKFTFRDVVPAATVMRFAPTCTSCTSVSAPAVGATGNLSGELPAVNSNTSYNFEFGVRYVGY